MIYILYQYRYRRKYWDIQECNGDASGTSFKEMAPKEPSFSPSQTYRFGEIAKY